MDGLHIFKAIVPFNYLENKPLDNVKHWLIIHLVHFTCGALQMQSSSWSSWNLNPWSQPSLLALCSCPRSGHCTSPGITTPRSFSLNTLGRVRIVQMELLISFRFLKYTSDLLIFFTKLAISSLDLILSFQAFLSHTDSALASLCQCSHCFLQGKYLSDTNRNETPYPSSTQSQLAVYPTDRIEQCLSQVWCPVNIEWISECMNVHLRSFSWLC